MDASELKNASVEQLQSFKDFILATADILDLDTLANALVTRLPRMLPGAHCLLLNYQNEHSEWKFLAIDRLPPESSTIDALRNFTIPAFKMEADPVIGQWLRGETMTVAAEQRQHPALSWLCTSLGTETLLAIPLRDRNRPLGLLFINNPATQHPPAMITMLTEAASLAMKNARTYTDTLEKSTSSMHELYVLRQIDRELNDTIELDHVFTMTLDWALRFTNAHAASLALYDQERDELRLMQQYGHDLTPDELAGQRPHRVGISYRVAVSGRAEVVPDVSMDKDFVRVTSFTQSQVSIPVLREDRVIAVITVESRKINGFTDAHVDFVEKLAARAGVAIDNARLFTETERERQKLSHILNNTADIVIVSGLDDRIVLINPAGIQALRLYPNQDYVGQMFQEVFAHTEMLKVFHRAKKNLEALTEEIVLPNERTFHINLMPQENIGWIIVMHDITMFKEMDHLKSELIATVSHDLKQPLSVMNGYTELLMLHNKLDETGLGFIEMVRKSAHNMRHLIDDILDLAKIESGIRLDLRPTRVKGLLTECITSLEPSIRSKEMTIVTDLPDNLPLVNADSARLQQIFANLIGNAVKYTQPQGEVQVRAEVRNDMIRISVRDNGMGISPEDQVHIFDRFYRVRRPETDMIEGTGLGLAIVKSLVEAHEGKIILESRLGEGSTFTVTLPVMSKEDPEKIV